MPSTYRTPDPGDQILELLAEVMREHHRPLAEYGVEVGVLFASNSEGPALVSRGVPCAATIKVVSLKDRVTKHYDAELVIDLRWWDDARQPHRRALLDHELSHLKLAKVEMGECTRDDLGRPKLKTVPGDLNPPDAFLEVIERHRLFALEADGIRRAAATVEAVIAAAEKGEPHGLFGD